MNSQKDRIQSLFLKEIAARGIPAALFSIPFALLVFFYRFNVRDFRLHLQIACIGVMIASAFRFYSGLRFKAGTQGKKYWRVIRLSVWFNTLCWGLIFALTAWELQASGNHFVAAMAMMIGFVAVSLITLSYDPWLFFPFNIVLAAPTGIIALYFAFVERNPSYCVLSITCLVFLLYQCFQYREYRRGSEERIQTQIELEESNSALKESQDALMENTMRLIQSQKTTALAEMAGGLSHEVNNSLMVILGSLRQVERNLKEEGALKKNYQEKFHRMSEAIMKINSVIEGLFYFSQEKEHQPLETVSLSEIIEKCQTYVGQRLRAHRIKLVVELIPETTIRCHPMKLIQSILTIVKNAEEAVTRVEDPAERWIHFNFKLKEGKVNIYISNGGPKIEEKLSQRLFQPFFTTKDIGQGSGLSLSIAKGIIKEHSGDLFFDDHFQNTCFVIELPAVKSEQDPGQSGQR